MADELTPKQLSEIARLAEGLASPMMVMAVLRIVVLRNLSLDSVTADTLYSLSEEGSDTDLPKDAAQLGEYERALNAIKKSPKYQEIVRFVNDSTRRE